MTKTSLEYYDVFQIVVREDDYQKWSVLEILHIK